MSAHQALKVLKTAEFMPYVVFIAAPDFDTLKAMHKAVVDAGITTKQLTVRGGDTPLTGTGRGRDERLTSWLSPSRTWT